MAGRYHKPCLDSSVFIGGLNGEIVNKIKRRVVLDYLWEKAQAGEFSAIYISAFAIAETYKKKGQLKANDGVYDEFLEFINESFVRVIELDRETALQAHELCRQYAGKGLMPSDAVHLASALRAGCDVLWAWDGPLTAITHPDIQIEEPYIYDRTFFTVNEIATPEEIEAYEQRGKPKALPAPKNASKPETQKADGETKPEPQATQPPPKEKEGLNRSTDISPSPKA